MYRSIPSHPSRLTPCVFAIALGMTTGATADYQQTLAARGADAFAQPAVTVEINGEELASTFGNNILEANPALSDQEVMIDLQARMLAEQRLEMAAAALDPTAVSDVVAQQSGTESNATQAEAEDPAPDDTVAESGDLEGTPAAVASR